MKKTLMAMLMMLTLWLPNSALAGPLDGLDEVKGRHAGILLGALSYMPWIADGKDNGQHVYILYSPTCGYSEQIYKETRAWKGDRPQLRWIPLDGQLELNSLFEALTPDTLAMMFDEEAIPEDRHPARNERLNGYLQFTLGLLANNKVIPTRSDRQMSMPTFILGTSEKLWVQRGYSDDWRKVFSAAPKGTPTDAQAPNLRNHISAELKILPLPKGLGYKNETGEKIGVVVAPYADAPQIATIDPGVSVTADYILGVTQDGFVLVGMSDTRIEMVIKDPQFTAKALNTKS